MAAAAEVRSDELELGRVVRLTFAVLGRRPALLFGLALVLEGLASAISGSLHPRSDPAAILASPSYWFAFAVSMVLRAFLSACIFDVALAELSGEAASLDDAVAAGRRMFLPLLALTVVGYLGVILGLLLLIVPGLMLAIAWSMAGPALVAERGGIFPAFRRSDELTRGNRWRILALFLIYAIAVTALQALTGTLSFAGSQAASPVRIVLTSIVGGVTTPVLYVGTAVLYAELRRLNNGLGAGGLGEVFD